MSDEWPPYRVGKPEYLHALGVIEMNAVGAIEFGPCGQHVRLVDGVNDEEHSRSLPDGS